MAKQKRLGASKDVANEKMEFITKVRDLVPGQLEPHGGGPEAKLVKKTEEVKEDFVLVMNQLNFIVAAADKASFNKGFKLEEITISLGFSAKGKIAFIAEAGIEASIEVKFSRKS